MPPKVFPAYFVAHGGGPFPLLENAPWDNSKLVKSWLNSVSQISRIVGQPDAIIVISAHYQTNQVSIGTASNPKMLFDYSGFPPEMYKLKYPAPGSPAVARRALDLLARAGIPAKEDPTRPYDHGVFVPLIKMFPEAAIPVIPISVMHNEDPLQHINVGKALAPLRAEGVFIIGSGFTVHNFGVRGSQGGITFNSKLVDVLTSDGLSVPDRIAALTDFLTWTGAEEAQSRATGTEHFMPLLVTFGTAAETGKAKLATRLTLPKMGETTVDVVEFWFGEEATLAQLNPIFP